MAEVPNSDSARFSYGSSLADQRLLGDTGSGTSTSTSNVNVSDRTLDSIVSVNSFFAVAVFVGLSMSFNTSARYTSQREGCSAGINTSKHILRYEILSFGCFLLSTLTAHGLKICSVLATRRKCNKRAGIVEINKKVLVGGMLISAAGSVAGTALIVLSLIHIIFLKFGPMHCGNDWAEGTIIPLIGLVGTGLALFMGSIIYELFHS